LCLLSGVICQAQDFLEPETGSLADDAFEFGYYANLRKSLMRDADAHHMVRMICLPPGSPEWAVAVRSIKPGEWEVELNVAEKQIWSSDDPQRVRILRSAVAIDGATASDLFEVWDQMLHRVKYAPDDPLLQHDAINYHFSSAPNGRRTRCGEYWAEAEGLGGERAVEVLVTLGELLKDYVRGPNGARPSCIKAIRSKAERMRELLDPIRVKKGKP